eukprot:365372-Chlamydomonas_euryale.AAC.13
MENEGYGALDMAHHLNRHSCRFDVSQNLDNRERGLPNFGDTYASGRKASHDESLQNSPLTLTLTSDSDEQLSRTLTMTLTDQIAFEAAPGVLDQPGWCAWPSTCVVGVPGHRVRVRVTGSGPTRGMPVCNRTQNQSQSYSFNCRERTHKRYAYVERSKTERIKQGGRCHKKDATATVHSHSTLTNILV